MNKVFRHWFGWRWIEYVACEKHQHEWALRWINSVDADDWWHYLYLFHLKIARWSLPSRWSRHYPFAFISGKVINVSFVHSKAEDYNINHRNDSLNDDFCFLYVVLANLELTEFLWTSFLQDTLLRAVRSTKIQNTAGVQTPIRAHKWSYASAFLYSITLITTIGEFSFFILHLLQTRNRILSLQTQARICEIVRRWWSFIFESARIASKKSCMRKRQIGVNDVFSDSFWSFPLRTPIFQNTAATRPFKNVHGQKCMGPHKTAEWKSDKKWINV